jgi:hypothetical protein
LRSLAFAAALFCLVALALDSASAQAATGYQQAGAFGSGSLPNSEAKMAVDKASGDVLVVSPLANAVQVYNSAGPAATVIAEFGTGPGELAHPFGIAIDPGNGDVYVSNVNSSSIQRYKTNGANPPEYTLDPAFVSPEAGSGPAQIGSFESALAVDPSTGDLLVADHGNERVSRYTSAGAFVSSFNGSDTEEGAFHNLLDLAVTPGGDIYVLDLNGFLAGSEVFGVGSRIEHFTSTGSSLGSIGGSATKKAVSLAYDAAGDNVLFATQYAFYQEGFPELFAWHNGAFAYEARIENVNRSPIPAIAVDPGAGGNVYALTVMPYGGSFGEVLSVQVFEPRQFPDVLSVSEVEPTSATVSGTVYPAGVPTTYRFEYRTVQANTWSSTPEENAGSGSTPVPVSAHLTGLEANIEYLVRIASNGVKTGVRAFTTPPSAPLAITGDTSEVKQTSAYLRGIVNPYGSQTTYHFEYGLTTAYGSSAPAGAGDVAGKDHGPFSVGHGIAGLQPGATYHYRLVAENAFGEAFGEDKTFTTQPPGALRAYEMVSPIEKQNVSVSTTDVTVPLVSPNGESIVYETEKSTYPGAEATFYMPRVVSKRSPDGWTTQTMDPPINNSVTGELRFRGTSAVSEDQTRAVVSTNRKLTPDAIESDRNIPGNLYLKDLTTGAYTLIASGDVQQWELNGNPRYLGGSADLSTVVFWSQSKLLPEASEGEGPYGGNYYEWREGQGLSLVSTAPNGGAPLNAWQLTTTIHDPNAVSRDGSMTYFNAFPQGGDSSLDTSVYLHTRGSGTKAIAVSQRPGDPTTPVAAGFVGASPDGRYAVFVTSRETHALLTPDAPAGSQYNAYLYDNDTGSLTYLASNVEANGGTRPVFDPAGDVFFETESLTPGLYFEHNGVVKEVASGGSEPTGSATWSPNRHFFIFAARGDVTGFDSEGFEEIYRFDVATEEVTCVSCRTDGEKPTGDARFAQWDTPSEFQRHAAQVVRDDGAVYFDTPDPLLPADVNGTKDVYAYENGAWALISPGDAHADAEIAGVSPDGSNVFFKTTQQLVTRDIDQSIDIYDARVGGGIAWQNEPLSRGCESEDCRSSYATPTPFQPLGSEGIQVAGKGKSAAKQGCPKGQHKVKKNGKTRCVKKPKKQKAKGSKHRRAGKSGRTGR